MQKAILLHFHDNILQRKQPAILIVVNTKILLIK